MNTLKESAKIVGKNFEGWSPLLVEESRNAGANGRVGTELLLESSVARIWSIDLKPGQRLPFHTHVLNYFWTVLTSGTARSHSSEGVTTEIEYRPGDTKHLHYRAGERMTHDLENVGKSNLVFVAVEFLQSDNAPLKLDH
jgi:quercetin dioxygenase-like cupin family protein